MIFFRDPLRPALGLLAFTSTSAISLNAALADSVFPAAFDATNAQTLLAGAALAGAAAACAILAALYRRQAQKHTQRMQLQTMRLEALSPVETNFKALSSLEPQTLVIWSEGVPRLALHTLPGVVGVPVKLAQLLRFPSWLHPDDAEKVGESLSRLEAHGEAFTANASTIEGHVIEISGAVSGADAALRVRLFSPVNKELVRLIGENKRLKHMVQDRENLLDSLPMPVWLRDAKGQLAWANTAYVSAVNADSRGDAIDKKIELFETRQRAELLRLSQTKKPERLKLQTIVNGGVQIYEAIAAPFERGSGGAAFDVAPLAIAKDELERQMAAHSRTLDKVSTGVAVFGADRKLAYSNDAFARIWSLDANWLAEKPSASEFLDQLRQRRLLPEQSDYRKWRDSKVLAWDNNRLLDEFWHRPDGRTLHVVTDRRDEGGVTFLFDDVTEKLSLERQFHSLIEGQGETLDHLSEGIAAFSADGRLQLFNPAFQAIWRLDASMLEGAPHYEAIQAQSEDLARDRDFWHTLRQAITGMPEARDTFSGTVAWRDDMHLAYAVTPLPDGGTLVTFADVTDRKRFEEVLLERNEALEASDRLKTSFLSHVSYELRTPLTSIIGFSDLLAEEVIGPLNPKQRDYLNDIKTSSQALLNIINDILDLAVIDAGGMDIKLVPVQVEEVIEAAALGVRERLSRANVTLEIHIGKSAGTVMADSNRLIQVIYNLLSNAIGFSPQDSTITLTCRREKNGVAISVQDNGLGIPEEEQATMFDRFESRSKGSRHRGAGLGLSLVKSIVQLHKGRIDLRSTPGAGTTVTVFLPDRHPALHQKDRPGPGKGGRKTLAAQ